MQRSKFYPFACNHELFVAPVTFIDLEDGVSKEHLKAFLNSSTCVQHFVEPHVRGA